MFSASWLSLLAISTLAVAAIAQETNMPIPTPGPTPAVTSTTFPAPTPASSAYPAPTPASSKVSSPCWEVSVEHDATYRVDGPLCSGSGSEPAGLSCPKKGDVAVAGCWKYLESYVQGGQCVAPVDAECRKIATGAWGCVWKEAGPKPTPAASIPIWPTTPGPQPTPASSVVTDPKPTPASSVGIEPKPTPASTDNTKPTPTPAATGSTSSTSTPTATTKKDPTLPVNASSFDNGATIQITTDAPQTEPQSANTLSSNSNESVAPGVPGALIGVVAAVAGIALVGIGAAYYMYRHRTARHEDFNMGTPHGAFASDKKGPNALLSLPRQTTITA